MRQNMKSLLFKSSFLLLSILFIPIAATMFFPNTPFCPLSIANAQGSPCLVQDATITAQELAIVQLQVTNIALNNRVAELEAGGVQVNTGGTIANTPGLPFVENFDNNDNGWSFSPGIFLSNGELIMGSGADQIMIPIPPLNNFYIEVDGIIESSWAGLAIKFGNESYHILFFDSGDFGNQSSNRNDIGIYEVDFANDVFSLIVETDFFDIRTDTYYTVGMAYQGGQVEIYVDNELILITQVNGSGSELWLQKWGRDFDVVRFDNLVVRESR
jgi:hypothetical protein